MSETFITSWRCLARPPRPSVADALGWLAEAGYGYQALRKKNAAKVRRMSQLSGALGVLMVVQTLAWLAALAVH